MPIACNVIARMLALCVLALGSAACGGGSSSGPTIDVSGVVMNGHGVRLANIPVYIGETGPYTTGSDGRFTAPGIAVPYRAVVIGGAEQVASVYDGLTSPEPVLGLALDPVEHTADISGTVSGGAGFPEPASHKTEVWVHLSAFPQSDTANTNTGTYSFTGLAWTGAPTTTVDLYALQSELDASGFPTSFPGYGTLTVPLTDGDMLMGQNIVMNAVPAATLSGTMSAPAGYVTLGRTVLLSTPTGARLPLPSGSGGPPSFMLQAPVVPDLSYGHYELVQTPTGGLMYVVYQNLSVPGDILVEVPQATEAFLPVDGVTGVTTETPFQVAPDRDDRIYTVTFEPDGGSGPRITLATMSETFTIPDLSAYGLPLPSGAPYKWSASAVGPVSSLDELRDFRGFVTIAPHRDHAVIMLADSRTFTTAP